MDNLIVCSARKDYVDQFEEEEEKKNNETREEQPISSRL